MIRVILLAGFILASWGSFSQASPGPMYTDHSRLLYYLDDRGRSVPVTGKAAWEKRREHILAGMQQVMGPLPRSAAPRTVTFRVLETVELPLYKRVKIAFQSEPGDEVPAYLFLPARPGKLPAVLCLHQTSAVGKQEPAGVAGDPKLPYARELAERGFVTLAPDYPNFGEYRIDVYKRGYTSGTMKAIWNNIRAVDLLQSLPEVDAARIGAIGHSLGGHNAIFTAVFDTRIKATVSSCGFTSFAKYKGGDITGWTGPTYMPALKTYRSPAEVPFEFHELIAALAPRAFYASAPIGDSNFDNGGVREVVDSARGVYKLLGAEERLVADYPDLGHVFPLEQREKAYSLLRRWLAD